MVLKFHQRTLEMVGQPNITLDPQRRALARSYAGKWGVSLPLALEEWFSIPSSSDVWKWYLNEDCSAQPEEIGIPGGFQGVEAEPFYLHNPGYRYDILVFMGENQGGGFYGVFLEGKEDPIVLATDQLEWTTLGDPKFKAWLPCAKSFSEFVYSRMFLAPFQPNGLWYYKPGKLLWQEDFKWLRENFVEHPFSVSFSGKKYYRYALKDDESSRFEIADSSYNLSTGWNFRVANQERLDEIKVILRDYLDP